MVRFLFKIGLLLASILVLIGLIFFLGWILALLLNATFQTNYSFIQGAMFLLAVRLIVSFAFTRFVYEGSDE